MRGDLITRIPENTSVPIMVLNDEVSERYKLRIVRSA